MSRLKSSAAYMVVSTFGVLLALCVPAAQASAEVPTWHLGQKNLSEVTGPVEFFASGTGAISWPTLGATAELKNCAVSGSGTLSGKSTLTYSGCQAYWAGEREAHCDPLPITLNLSASMETPTFNQEFEDEECWLPKVEVHASTMKLEGGIEAIKPALTVSEHPIFGVEKSPGSITGSLHLSLVGSYFGRSFGLGPAPLVHINGQTLAQLGKTETAFTSSGTLRFEFPTEVEPTFSCTETGSGTLRARGLYQEEATLKCVVVGQEKSCKVETTKVGFVGSFESSANSFVVLHTVEGSGQCSAEGTIEIANPTGYLNYGVEAGPLQVQRYAKAYNWGGVIISGETHWSVPSGNLGIW